MQRLIIFRGAPASGKTTLAKSFRNFQMKTVWLKIDNFKDFFGEETEEQLLYAYRTSLPVLQYLLKNGLSVVMDGIFRDVHLDILRQATQEAQKRNIPVKVFQLTCSLQTLLERDTQRVEATNYIRRPIGNDTLQEIYDNIKKNPYEGAIILNTEQLSQTQCIERIIDSFS